MKKEKKYFIYFVLVAPILAKISEWIVQYFTFGGLSHLAHGVWLMQIIFIEFVSLLLYFILFKFIKIKTTILNGSIFIGLTYFTKELYNLIFVHKILSASSIIALTIEPVVIFLIVGLLFSKLIFKKKIFK